ncbi:unnamed protein product, partial [Prorocentrum cordatum]
GSARLEVTGFAESRPEEQQDASPGVDPGSRAAVTRKSRHEAGTGAVGKAPTPLD